MKYIYLFAIALFCTPAMAESVPACNMESEGQTYCMSQRMCECKHFHGSLMKGTPEGYRWDCGITRPNCLDYNKVEEVRPYDGPQSVGEGSNTSISTEVNN
jgi:hypothetical protein